MGTCPICGGVGGYWYRSESRINQRKRGGPKNPPAEASHIFRCWAHVKCWACLGGGTLLDVITHKLMGTFDEELYTELCNTIQNQ